MLKSSYSKYIFTGLVYFFMFFSVEPCNAAGGSLSPHRGGAPRSLQEKVKNYFWKNRRAVCIGAPLLTLAGSLCKDYFFPEAHILGPLVLGAATYIGAQYWVERKENELPSDVRISSPQEQQPVSPNQEELTQNDSRQRVFGKKPEKKYDLIQRAARHVTDAVAAKFGEKTVQELIEPGMERVKSGMKPTTKALEDLKEESKFMVKKILLTSAGVLGIWYAARFIAHKFEQFLSQPYLDVVIKKAESNLNDGTLAQQMIFAPAIRDRLNTILSTTLAIKQHIKAGTEGMVYRNLLLHGPPGSGKRMFAEQLAHYTRMDFYEISWTGLNKFKDGDAERAISQFFDHDILQAKNGAIIYIDNAQMFLHRHQFEDQLVPTSITKLVNALVHYTEKRSNKFMVIFGVPSQPNFGSDALMVVDDIVEVTRPGLPERRKLLNLYKDLYFRPDTITEETLTAVQHVLDDATIESLAEHLDKASAAELAGFMKTLKIESELPTSNGLTPELIADLEKRSTQRYKELIA